MINQSIKAQLLKFGQYKYDIFSKLDFNFIKGKKILDVGCGDGIDADILIKVFKLKTYGIDIYQDSNIVSIKNFRFKVAGIYNIPYRKETFDYVFLHDILHHIDEKKQSYKKHTEGLKELKRVTKKNGYIIIVEGNRYNPLFYPHMVKHFGHNHFKQSYFQKIILNVFPNAKFIFFESHVYPKKFLPAFKAYEKIMEKFVPKKFLAYNVAIVRNAPLVK